MGLALVRALTELPLLEPRTQSSAFSDTDDTPLGRAIAPRAAAHPGLSGIHLLSSALDAFAARALLARVAERSIDAQYYIWHQDLTGSLLFEELRAATARGVRVRLLLDDNSTAGMDALLAEVDADENIEVRLFNPFVIRTPRFLGYLTDFHRLNRRMHNKSFTIDNQATIIGGRNVGDEYFGAHDDALFVDLDVLAVGPVVREVSCDFDRYWASASSFPAERILSPPGRGWRAAHSLRTVSDGHEARRYADAIRELPFVSALIEGGLPLEWAPVRMVSDDPAKALGLAAPDGLLIPKLQAILEEPRRVLGLVSSYFVPTAAGTEAFIDMAARGVAVTIVTNSLEATDVPIVHAGYARWRKPLLRAGVRIYEMRGPPGAAGPKREITGIGSTGSRFSGAGSALHAKTFAVDRERVFIGSFNFDPRSANLNTELGFVIHSPVFAERLHAAFERFAPDNTYEVRLSREKTLYWVERQDGREIRHDTEPGTKAWQRALVWGLSLLPIEWLL